MDAAAAKLVDGMLMNQLGGALGAEVFSIDMSDARAEATVAIYDCHFMDAFINFLIVILFRETQTFRIVQRRANWRQQIIMF